MRRPTTAPPIPNELQNATCGQVCKYDDWFNRAFCDDRGLNFIPSSAGCSRAVALDFQGNSIWTIVGNTMAGYPLVELLDLSGNSISDLEPGTFNETSSLTNLILSNNALGQILNGSFVGADSMERLYLNRNDLLVIEVGALSGLRKLSHLDLSLNRLQSLARNLFEGLVKLEYLSLSNNRLDVLHEDTFGGLQTLQFLHLDHNQLTFLPANLFAGLASLQQIYLAHNRLSEPCLSPTILGITSQLEYYDIRHNNITDIACMIPYIGLAERSLFEGNPLKCNCDFERAREWFLNVSVVHPVTDNSDMNTLLCTHENAEYQISDGPLPQFCDAPGSEGEINTDRNPYTRSPSYITTGDPTRTVTTKKPMNGDSEADRNLDPVCPPPADRGDVMQSSKGLSEWYHWIILVTVLYSAVIQSLIVGYLLYKKRMSCTTSEYECSVPTVVSG